MAPDAMAPDAMAPDATATDAMNVPSARLTTTVAGAVSRSIRRNAAAALHPHAIVVPVQSVAPAIMPPPADTAPGRSIRQRIQQAVRSLGSIGLMIGSAFTLVDGADTDVSNSQPGSRSESRSDGSPDGSHDDGLREDGLHNDGAHDDGAREARDEGAREARDDCQPPERALPTSGSSAPLCGDERGDGLGDESDDDDKELSGM